MKKLIFVLAYLLLTVSCGARTITVDNDGPADFDNIQAAINIAVDGDEIIVSIGTYYGKINFNGKNIILRSTEPTNPIVVANTVINGRRVGSVVTFSGTESAACILSGFTITNGSGTLDHIGGGSYSNGGGIYGNGTLATIQHNIISRNYALFPITAVSGCGGGIYNCDGIIQCNIISENTASQDMEGGDASGGGLFGCDGIIQNNIISNNRVVGSVNGTNGGGLVNCNGTIRNNTIFGNSAGSGGGLSDCNSIITNCIIWQNAADIGAQIYASSTPSYCCIQDWSGGGVGNISDNPLLVDPNSRDFHLQPGSPCKDIGTPIPGLTEDFEGDLRPLGAGYDIGADEFISDNSPPDKPANISPANGATNVSLTPTLNASAFSDPDAGDTHQASQWHVWVYGTTWTVLASTKSYGDLRSVTIPPRTLSDNIAYAWRVRYQDKHGSWSCWSDATEFTTEETSGVITVPGDYPTIQSAINIAIYGDEIVISPGKYVENINFKGKNIILRSTEPTDPCIVASTIIDGNKTGTVVTFLGYEPSSCILSGFTITNGHGNERGGGINGGGTSPKIQNNIISGNLAEGLIAYGGGLYNCNGIIRHNKISGNSVIEQWSGYGGGGGLCYCDGIIQDNLIMGNSAINGSGGGLGDCDGIIQGNTIKENSADNGAGLIGCDGTIQNNVIAGNFTTGNSGCGGGLYQCHGTVQNNLICGNSAQRYGGGIYYSTGTIQNNTICGNSASYGGGLSRCIYGDTVIRNCIIWGNTCTDSQIGGSGPIYFSCIEGWTGGGLGNISTDPCFVDDANDDYHLKSASPCINAGDPNYVPGPNETDLDGLPRVIGGRIDMGAYEFNHQPVAVAGPNQIVFAWIDGFADVNLDGSGSYDDDNDMLDYSWSWTIDGNTYEATGIIPTIKLPVGNHTIELVVDDGIDLSEPDYCTITVIKAVRGKLTIAPRILQTKNRGKWIIATLYLPPVIGERVNTNEPLRLYPSGIEAKYQHFYRFGRFQCAPTFAIAFFDKQIVSDALGTGRFEVSVVGEFLSGRFFFGSDTIRIISPPPSPPHHRR